MSVAMSLSPCAGSVPRWEELPDEVRADVKLAALERLQDRRYQLDLRLHLLDKRIHPRARHLEPYKRENRWLSDKLERIDRAIDAVRRLR